MNFPADECKVAVPLPALIESFGVPYRGKYKGRWDYIVVLSSRYEQVYLEAIVIVLSTIPARGIIVTAPGTDVDFVSCFFAPQFGIDEDPVTGSSLHYLFHIGLKSLLRPFLQRNRCKIGAVSGL